MEVERTGQTKQRQIYKSGAQFETNVRTWDLVLISFLFYILLLIDTLLRVSCNVGP